MPLISKEEICYVADRLLQIYSRYEPVKDSFVTIGVNAYAADLGVYDPQGFDLEVTLRSPLPEGVSIPSKIGNVRVNVEIDPFFPAPPAP